MRLVLRNSALRNASPRYLVMLRPACQGCLIGCAAPAARLYRSSSMSFDASAISGTYFRCRERRREESWRVNHGQKGAFMRMILRFAVDDLAATAIEYSMIAAGIAVAIVAVIQSLGTTVNTLFVQVSTSLK